MDPQTPGAGQAQARPKIAQNIIAVASGKGGVGKSTVAANLACALKEKGKSVALVDADLYGPSIPTMFGVPADEKPSVGQDQQTIIPLEKFGLKLMSMGFLVPQEEAIIWRGPMLGKMLQQFLYQVDWGKPDYIVLDLPPGTGDVQLSLSQLVAVNGAVLVSTPQDVALADVKRAVRMFEKTNVPLIGLVENMSYFHCPDNGKDYELFGGGPSKKGLASLNLELLTKLPIEPATCQAADAGKPIVLADPQSEQAKRFLELADKVIAKQNEIEELELPSLEKTLH